MLDLYKVVGNALKANNTALRVTIASADNFSTIGYYSQSATLQTGFASLLTPGTEFTNPISKGAGVTIAATRTDFSQGSITFGTELDAAIDGEGFFIISKSPLDSDFGGEKLYTRAGQFQVDFSNEFLTDAFGRKIFGFELDDQGNIVSNNPVPIQTEGHTDIGWIEGGVLVTNFKARQTAIENAEPELPEQVPLYRLAITNFPNKQGLIYSSGGGSAFQASFAAGEPFAPSISGDASFGDIVPETLESSNVDVAKIGLDMAQINRSFSAIQGVIDDINKVMNGLITKLSG